MSQHDYIISDQDGLSFLADLNNSISAIVSNNSGATAPADPYAYMYWADTTSGILKQRNAANTAWVSLLSLADGVPSNANLAALAGLTSSANKIPYFTGSGTAAMLDTNGVLSVTITPSSDADVTLSSSEYYATRLVLADGSWTAGHNIIVPNENRVFFIDNTGGTYDAVIKTSAGTGITVRSGSSKQVLCNGTNVIDPNIADTQPLITWVGMGSPYYQDISTSTTTAVTWGSPYKDEGGMWSAGTPTRLTIPAGYTKVKFAGRIVWKFDASAGGDRAAYVRQIVGTPATGRPGTMLTNVGTSLSIGPVMNFEGVWMDVSAGDVFELVVWHNGGITLRIQNGDDLGASILSYFGAELKV
jgi:hypothetical protein